MFVPVLSGMDKTTVSVATGQNDYHPIYMSLGNLHNSVRQAHLDAVLPVAFLAIPKGIFYFCVRIWTQQQICTAPREQADTAEFRLFRKQLYHASLAKIFAPLRQGMVEPKAVRCPDDHFRRVIFGLGPIIADYPEQVVLSSIVSGWCPKYVRHAYFLLYYLPHSRCNSFPYELDRLGEPRDPAFSEKLVELWDPGILWMNWGIDTGVTVSQAINILHIS
jgi:hypothetical protein